MKYLRRFMIPVMLFSIVFYSCEKDETPTSFEAVIDMAGGFESPTTSEMVSAEITIDSLINGENWVCTRETKDLMAAGGGSNGFPLFSPNAGIVFPGSLVQGASLGRATLDPIGVKRAGGTISTDILDGNQFSSIEVDEVDKGSVTQAINNIIFNSTGIVPANFIFTYNSIQSREEFALELGVDAETAFTEIEGNLGLDFEKEVNRYYVKLEQSFYTMSFNMPTSYDDVFAPEVTPAELQKYVQPGNPACYISEVTYGRIFYMIIESTSSMFDMEAAVSGSYNGVGVEVNADLAIEKMSSLDNLKISVFAFGGETESTFNAIGQTNINDLKTVLGQGADIRSGKALSYVVKSVYDNRIVATQLATQYDVINCIPGIDDSAPSISRHWAGVSSKIGTIGAAFAGKGTEIFLIGATGDQYMVSNIGTLEGPYPISNLGVGEMPFDKVGAACNLDGNNWTDGTIMLFDDTGTRYTYLIGGPGSNWRGANSIFDLHGGQCPFNSSGVGGLSFVSKDSDGPSRRLFYNSPGTKYTIYNNNPQSWTDPKNIAGGKGFDLVGAGLGVELGDDLFEFYFDKEAAQYSVWGNHNGTGKTVIGPFKY